MEKIKMQTPLVEMDGDEMTRILWKMIKDELILPFVDLKTEYYDLGLPKRDATGDQITVEAAEATKKYGVAVKCATITPNAKRMDEYKLHQMWKSPNGTIRSILDGTVFRTPITIPSIKPVVKNWEQPITIARHAYGDVYKSVEMRVPEAGVAKLVFDGESGKHEEVVIHNFKGAGVLQGMHNLDKSITSFAHSCFKYALDTNKDLWFATKDTISKKYDGQFREIFEKARVVRSKGGYIWACKNYDGDVMSDMISTAFGSLAMMTSVLVSPDGNYEYEAAHGTVTRHYYKYLKGEETSTNPIATIFAWSGALRKRGEKDGIKELMNFADQLEGACFDTLNEGTATKDLVNLMEGITPKQVNSADFIAAIRSHLEQRLA